MYHRHETWAIATENKIWFLEENAKHVMNSKEINSPSLNTFLLRREGLGNLITTGEMEGIRVGVRQSENTCVLQSVLQLTESRETDIFNIGGKASCDFEKIGSPKSWGRAADDYDIDHTPFFVTVKEYKNGHMKSQFTTSSFAKILCATLTYWKHFEFGKSMG